MTAEATQKVTTRHLTRTAYLYIRQSTVGEGECASLDEKPDGAGRQHLGVRVQQPEHVL